MEDKKFLNEEELEKVTGGSQSVDKGWECIDGKWRYIENGVIKTGWSNDIPGWEGKWFYFDLVDGFAKTGLVDDIPGWEGQSFFFAGNGVLMTGINPEIHG